MLILVLLFCLVHSFAYEKDTGCKNFLEDVFENEERFPGGNWNPSSVNWTDIVSGQAQVYRVCEILSKAPFICYRNDTRKNLSQFRFPFPSISIIHKPHWCSSSTLSPSSPEVLFFPNSIWRSPDRNRMRRISKIIQELAFLRLGWQPEDNISRARTVVSPRF